MHDDLMVIAASKKLAEHIFRVGQRAPKQYRFSLIGRLQNLSLDIVGLLYRANETFIDQKMLTDMDKSIQALTGRGGYATEQERYFHENKLFMLKLNRAQLFDSRVQKRFDRQHEAMTRLKELDFLLTLSRDMGALLPKQQEQAAKLLFDARNLLGAWIKADKKRFGWTK